MRALFTDRRLEIAALTLSAVVAGVASLVFLLEGARVNGGFALALASNYIFLVVFSRSAHSEAPAAVFFFALTFAVFFGLGARNPAYPISHEIVDVLFVLLHGAAIGAFFKNVLLRIVFVVLALLVVVVSCFTMIVGGLQREWGIVILASVFVAVFGLGLLYQSAAIVQFMRGHSAREWCKFLWKKAVQPLHSIAAFKWQEWLGVGLLVLTILRLLGLFVQFHGQIIGLLIGFYKGAIEWLPQRTVESIAALFGAKPSPVWIGISLFLGICVRAADLHSKYHTRIGLWESIKARIWWGHDVGCDDMFNSKSSRYIVDFASALIALSALTVIKINPIQYLAGNKVMTVQSMLAVGALAFLFGTIASVVKRMEQEDSGLGVCVRVIATLTRALLYGPPLLVIAPFIAWRLVILCTLLAAGLLVLNALVI